MTENIEISSCTGKIGEDAACRYLEDRGHLIVERNWRSAHREVDIISFLGNKLHFVEVKTKRAPIGADPILSVTMTKQRNIIAAAKAYMNSPSRKKLPDDLEVLFDVLTVILNNNDITINYYPDAYKAIYV